DCAELGLADALLSAQRQRSPALLVGMLKDVGEPSNYPVVERAVVLTNILMDMGQKLRAVALARLDGEAAPQIVEAGDVPAGKETKVEIFAPLRVRDPVLGLLDDDVLAVFLDDHRVLAVPFVEGHRRQQLEFEVALGRSEFLQHTRPAPR